MNNHAETETLSNVEGLDARTCGMHAWLAFFELKPGGFHFYRLDSEEWLFPLELELKSFFSFLQELFSIDLKWTISHKIVWPRKTRRPLPSAHRPRRLVMIPEPIYLVYSHENAVKRSLTLN